MTWHRICLVVALASPDTDNGNDSQNSFSLWIVFAVRFKNNYNLWKDKRLPWFHWLGEGTGGLLMFVFELFIIVSHEITQFFPRMCFAASPRRWIWVNDPTIQSQMNLWGFGCFFVHGNELDFQFETMLKLKLWFIIASTSSAKRGRSGYEQSLVWFSLRVSKFIRKIGSSNSRNCLLRYAIHTPLRLQYPFDFDALSKFYR